jgi:hypothetical protein
MYLVWKDIPSQRKKKKAAAGKIQARERGRISKIS